ncbi:MAG: methyltransferase domain-containing protein [Gammaproteobacteria bacterium]|nr:methyltransferase domain-containing protein [Gammaproteobacteria bacterium]
MPKTSAFDEHASAYDAWFDEHEAFYQLELKALQQLVPTRGEGIEIGVGTGRFAIPLGINTGVEPAEAMRVIAQEKGIHTISAVAEHLPLEAESFDYVLFVTTLCFLDSIEKAFNEAFRILKPGGALVIGFIDKDSDLGQQYQQRKNESRFYQEATFHSVNEVVQILESCQFNDFKFMQTLLPDSETLSSEKQIQAGYGAGAFVVVRALKPA